MQPASHCAPARTDDTALEARHRGTREENTVACKKATLANDGQSHLPMETTGIMSIEGCWSCKYVAA